MPNFFELISVEILPRYAEGASEAEKCVLRLRTSKALESKTRS